MSERVINNIGIVSHDLDSASINDDLKTYIVLQTICEYSASFDFICAILERCVEKSHVKPDDEIWIVEDKIGSIATPLQNFLELLISSDLVQEKENLDYVLSPDGKLYLDNLKVENLPHYQSIISMPFMESHQHHHQSPLTTNTGELAQKYLLRLGFPENAVASILKLNFHYFVDNEKGLWIGIVDSNSDDSFVSQMKQEFNITVDYLTHNDCSKAKTL